MTINFFYLCLSLLFLDPGSEIRDPGWIKIRIRNTGGRDADSNPDLCLFEILEPDVGAEIAPL
jgi:hypothetical protein